jgi:RimJ/RimL family protein N-acetyltransferase
MAPRAAPVLETARLTLRPFAAGDLGAQAAMMSDPETTRFLGGKTLTREEAWRKWLCGPGLWALLGYGYWAVERKADGAMIGQAGFADFKRDIQPGIEGVPEMGWAFAAAAAGQGYATEAVAAGLAWADRTLDASEIVAIVDAANLASIRIAEKSGFTAREQALYRGEPILLFRRKGPTRGETMFDVSG